MRMRHALLMTLASAALTVAPSLAGAQRTVTQDCMDRYSIDARRHADCRYETDRSRERSRWDAIVRQARTQARSYDLAARSRERAAERATRSRVINEQRQDRIRERRESVLRDRSYRVR
jgi:hypothetical protein